MRLISAIILTRAIFSGVPLLNWSTVMFRERRTENGDKRHKPEEIDQKLRQVDVLVGQEMARVDAIREVRITKQTHYCRRKQYRGMEANQLKELKRLQKENERLRKAVADLTLDKLILKEAARETSETRPTSRLHRTDPHGVEGIGTPDLSRVGAASLDAAASSTGPE